MTESALSGGRFCLYKLKDEERSLRRRGRRIARRQRVGGFFGRSGTLYIRKLRFFGKTQIPEVARSRCRDLFLSKYYACAVVFIAVILFRMHDVRTRATRSGVRIDIHIKSNKVVGVRLPFFC